MRTKRKKGNYLRCIELPSSLNKIRSDKKLSRKCCCVSIELLILINDEL